MDALKSKFTRSPRTSPRSSVDLSSNSNNHDTPKVAQEAEKYKLLITAGPSYDTTTHKIVRVNTDTPTTISNEFLTAKIKVRIRNFRGLPSSSPSSSPYFDADGHEKDQYSVAFSFIPKQDLPSKDVVWGNDFDHPVRDRLPPGFNTAFRIVKEFVDPGLECDAYADEPWLYGPALSCWFALRVGEKGEGGGEERIPERREGEDVLREGADGSGATMRKELKLPDNNEKRRKHFLSTSNREAFVFEKDRLYSADFYNPYLDFGNFALKLPGFSIKVIKYIDEKSHTLRYVFKNRKTGDVYFSVNFNLLWGEQLAKAMKEDGEVVGGLAGAEVQTNGASTAEDESSRENQVDDEGDSEHVVVEPPTPVVESGSTQGFATETRPTHESGLEEEPGMRDKPDALQEEVKKMSIADTLLQTSTKDARGSGGGVLDEGVD